MFLRLKKIKFKKAGLLIISTVFMVTGMTKQAVADSQIRITAGDAVLTATMYDNATSRDFLSLLPMTLTLKDYAGTEKVSDLPKELSTEGAPSGSDPSVGDITLYAPWGNLAIFYRDFRYSGGLIIMGKIDGDADKIAQLQGDVHFELMD